MRPGAGAPRLSSRPWSPTDSARSLDLHGPASAVLRSRRHPGLRPRHHLPPGLTSLGTPLDRHASRQVSGTAVTRRHIDPFWNCHTLRTRGRRPSGVSIGPSTIIRRYGPCFAGYRMHRASVACTMDEGFRHDLRVGRIEAEGQEESCLRTALGMIDVQQIMSELAAGHFKGRTPPILAQGTERPTRTRSAAFTVARAPIGSGNSTS